MKYINFKEVIKLLPQKNLEKLNEKTKEIVLIFNDRGLSDSEKRDKIHKIIDTNSRIWTSIKKILKENFLDTCWYCEKKQSDEYSDLEHFYPKKEIKTLISLDDLKNHEVIDDWGFWDLAFDISNYRISCSKCNKQKGTKFHCSDNKNFFLDPYNKKDSIALLYNFEENKFEINPFFSGDNELNIRVKYSIINYDLSRATLRNDIKSTLRKLERNTNCYFKHQDKDNLDNIIDYLKESDYFSYKVNFLREKLGVSKFKKLLKGISENIPYNAYLLICNSIKDVMTEDAFNSIFSVIIKKSTDSLIGYKAEDITVLEGLEAVRKRPGMYIGSTSERGLHHLVWEVVDNSVDEALAGHCNKIIINVLEDNVIEVIDNGRGIPTGMHPKHGKSALEIVLTVLHAGGKFENDNYKVSGGLHGVGISVVNALSEWMEVYVKREGQIFHQRLERGKPLQDVKVIGKTKETGTRILFKADGEIFETLVYSFETLRNRLKELAYLNKGLEIVLTDSRKEEKLEETLKFDGGIIDFLAELEDGNEKLIKEPIYMNGEAEGVVVEIAMTYTIKQRESIFSFVNNINTHEGGTHVSGFRTALTRVVNDVAKTMGLIKERDGNFQGSDIREGMTAIISVKVPDPQFEGQTKTKLGSSEVTSIVSGIVGKYLKMHLEDTPADARNVIEKILMSKKAREAAKKARELVMRKSALEVGSLPGKLADCASKKPEECEVYIVEGDSAGGSAKQGRDRHTQAILPLRGKILNVEKAGLHRALENTEVRAMITAFGAGMNDEMTLEKLRYHKIIIMTDADVDGAHIRTLILTFLFRYMSDLITNGNIYIAQPPLFKITAGRSVQYAYTDKQMKDATDLLNSENRRFTLQRYKGLGEMNPEQLWETTMDPDTRTLLQVSIDDAVEADKLFDKLMGDKVEPRKKFLEDSAEFVKNLDI